jgi:alkylation response protein AidB-like acyl-CoA dehydrogenase
MLNKTLVASSSTEGFFQALPVIPPQYTASEPFSSHDVSRRRNATSLVDDKVLARILNIYLPQDATQVARDVHHMARLALHSSVLVHAVDTQMHPPVLRPLTTFGEENRFDPLWTTAGWKALKNIGFEEGVVAVGYDKQNLSWNRRIHSWALGHLWTCTDSMTGCPMAMTNGAATLLSRHLDDDDGDQPGRKEVFTQAYRRLISRDPKVAWTSGQWMTERSGGSDVSGTETVARRLHEEQVEQHSALGCDKDAVGMLLGPWHIDGFKWFSSATDSDMTILLAQTTRGLSAFYVPMRRRTSQKLPPILDSQSEEYVTELNGIRIQRLKDKLGTKSVPTAELELEGARAWLIGREGQGIKEVSAILNITRLSTAGGSAANWSRGLAICRAYTRVRKVRGALLEDNPQHLRWMADETVKYWAATHLMFFGVALLGTLEQDWDAMVKATPSEKLIPRDKDAVSTLLRLLTPVAKAQVSVASVDGLRQCMECLGGVGYCENNEDGGLLNIAKIYRDNLVNPIWEGTVSVMAEDVVRVITDKRLGQGNVLGTILTPWVERLLEMCSESFPKECQIIHKELQKLSRLVSRLPREGLLYHGRLILRYLETVVCACLLIFDGVVHGEETVKVAASRWIWMRCSAGNEDGQRTSWEDEAKMDKKIFYLDEGNTRRAEKL